MKSQEILKKYWGYPSFRDNQEQAVETLLRDEDLIYIAKTWDGKSICFQVPAVMKKGTAIVVSPLKALMKDQVDNLTKRGIKAATLNSSIEWEEAKEIYQNMLAGMYDLIYLSPEKLAQESFLEKLGEIQGGISYFIIDEFDSIEEYWSSGFRPEYLKLGEIRNRLELLTGQKIPVGVFTATATLSVQELVKEMLGLKDPTIFIGDLIGEHIKIDINSFINKNEKDQALFSLLKEIEKDLKKEKAGAIIFASTRKNVDALEMQLKKHKFSIGKYHAGMAQSRKDSSARKFMSGEINFMVCTNAFGRGVDKGNIRYVIHYGIPGNISAYLQEIGRAGRDRKESKAILMYSSTDVNSRNFMTKTSSQKQELQELLDLFNTSSCYIEKIATYFGRESKDHCEQCSNCKSEYKIEIGGGNSFSVKKEKRVVKKRKTTTSKKKSSITTRKKTTVKKKTTPTKKKIGTVKKVVKKKVVPKKTVKKKV